MVDLARALVEHRLRIPVISHGTEDRLPGVELLAGAAVRSLRQFVAVHLLHGGEDESVRLTDRWTGHAREGTLNPERTLVFIKVHGHVGAKVDDIGAEHPRAIVEIRVKDLGSEALPSAGGAAINGA